MPDKVFKKINYFTNVMIIYFIVAMPIANAFFLNSENIHSTRKRISFMAGNNNNLYEAISNLNYEHPVEVRENNIDINPNYNYYTQVSRPDPPNIFIENARLEINGEEVHYFNSFGQYVNITNIKVESRAINEGSIKLTVPELGIESMPPSFCSKENNVYDCTWSGLMNLIDSSKGYVRIIVNVTDSFGQNSQDIKAYELGIDNTPPVIVNLTTNHHHNGRNYLGNSSNVIIATIRESGAGFNQRKVYLSVVENNQQLIKKADECVKVNSNLWKCYWQNISANKDSELVDISIYNAQNYKSADDAGNTLGLYDIEADIDLISPEILNMSTSTKTGRCAVTGNPVNVKVRVREKGSYVEMVVDPSRISLTNKNQTTSCSRIKDDEFICELEINNIISSPTTENIRIWITDQAGNSVNEYLAQKICQLNLGDTPPKCVSYLLDNPPTVPARIDRKDAGLINFPIMARVSLIPCKNSEIYQKKVECVSPIAPPVDTRLLAEDTLTPIIRTNLGKISDEDQNTDIYELDCDMAVKISIGNTVYAKPQHLYIPLEIELFGNTLGTIDENIKAKLSKLNDEISDLEEEIESKEQISQYFNYLCTMAEAMSGINSAIQDAKSVLWSVSCTNELNAKNQITSGIETAMSAAQAYASECGPENPAACACAGALGGMSSAAGKVSTAIALGSPSKTAIAVQSFTAAASPCFPAASSGVSMATSGVMDWQMVAQHWSKTCVWGNSFHSFVENFIWPSGYIGPNLIGTIVKYSCMIYSCRLCSGEFWGRVMLDTVMSVSKAGKSPGYSSQITQYKEGDKGIVLSSSKQIRVTQEVKDLSMKVPFKKGDIKIKALNEEGKLRWPYLMASMKNSIRASEPATWLWMPYKSIHYASACLCLPGIIYNLKKERQIKCMQRNCIEAAAQAGVSTEPCDIAAKERYCLYIDSAQYKLHGFLGTMFKQMVNNIIQNLPYVIMGIGVKKMCPTYLITGDQQKCAQTAISGVCGPVNKQWESVVCGLIGALNTVRDIIDIFKGGVNFDKYNTDLQGHDYCAGHDTIYYESESQ